MYFAVQTKFATKKCNVPCNQFKMLNNVGTLPLVAQHRAGKAGEHNLLQLSFRLSASSQLHNLHKKAASCTANAKTYFSARYLHDRAI